MLRRLVLWMSVVSCVLAGRAEGQGTTLVVGVADAESGAALESALVRLPDFAFHARTDGMGRARVAGVQAGTWSVEVRRIGYKPLRVSLAFSGKDSLEAVLMLDRASETLDTVRVTAEAQAPAYLRDFTMRQKMGVGRFRTRADLLARHGDRPLASLLVAMFPGVTVEYAGSRAVVVSRRGGNVSKPTTAAPWLSDQVKPAKKGQVVLPTRPPMMEDASTSSGTRGCALRVYLDDQPLPDQDIGWLHTGDLAGIEYYSGDSAPVQYRRGNPCGVLLLWLWW